MPKRYKVTGEQPVLDGRQPGETFDATVPEDQERFLIEVGALKVISNNPAKDKRMNKSAKPRKKA